MAHLLTELRIATSCGPVSTPWTHETLETLLYSLNSWNSLNSFTHSNFNDPFEFQWLIDSHWLIDSWTNWHTKTFSSFFYNLSSYEENLTTQTRENGKTRFFTEIGHVFLKLSITPEPKMQSTWNFHSSKPLWYSNLLCNMNKIWPTKL